MNIRNESAFPNTEPLTKFNEPGEINLVGGLTKREYFAGLAMQGLLANSEDASIDGDRCTPEIIARTSVEMADELIKQLNQ